MASTKEEEEEQYLEDMGVPKLHDGFIQQYFRGRDSLIDQEKKTRTDSLFRRHLSPTAAEACAIVDQIRFEEHQTLWANNEYGSSDHIPGGEDVFPGLSFALAKERLQNSKLFKIVRRMPKGGLLHCHLQAMFEIPPMLQDALNLDGMHFSSPEPLTEEARETAIVVITFAKPRKQGASVWNKDYKSGELQPLAEVADSFPDGGREGFIKWYTSRCTISGRSSLNHHHGIDDVWRRFSSMFRVIGSLILYEPILRGAVRRMCEQLCDDGLMWAEIRSTFLDYLKATGSEKEEQDHSKFLEVISEEVEAFKATEKGRNFWGIRIIWTALRAESRDIVLDSMNDCLDMKQKFPDLISGFDLVGQEDAGKPLTDFVPLLFWFKKICNELKLELPLMLHAGETLGDGTAADENLFDAVLLGTRRIGHGFSLFKHPLLIERVKERRILIECCPISNEVLRLSHNVKANTIPALLARGVPVCLSNDDPAMLGQDEAALSYDYYQALQCWDNLGLAGLGSLSENSVRYAAFEDQNAKDWVDEIKHGSLGKGLKAKRLQAWAQQWERFCQEIVDEYGVDENLDPEE